MENPFHYGRTLNDDEIVDRHQELSEVVSALTRGTKLFLIGPRRFGKSTVLNASRERAAAKGHIVLSYNAEKFPTLDWLVRTLVADAAQSLRSGAERAGEQILKFFSRLRPELGFNPLDSTWSVKLGASAVENTDEEVKLIADAFDGLERFAAANARQFKVGLIIDEFQNVVKGSGIEAERQVRAAIQEHRHVGYVFAGSEMSLLSDMTQNAERPFYRLGRVRFLTAIPRPEFALFLAESFLAGGFIIEGGSVDAPDSGVIAHLLDCAEDVPYNVQFLAHECWETLRDRRLKKLSSAVVDDALDLIIGGNDPYYSSLWNGLTAIQQKVLVAAIAEGGINLQTSKVIRSVGKSSSAVQKALAALENRQILRDEKHEGRVRYRFEDPFFAGWIRKYIPNFLG